LGLGGLGFELWALGFGLGVFFWSPRVLLYLLPTQLCDNELVCFSLCVVHVTPKAKQSNSKVIAEFSYNYAQANFRVNVLS